jgi:hypothetical protein
MRINSTSVLVDNQEMALRFYADVLGFVKRGTSHSFAVEDVMAEFERLRALGVRFTQEPAEMVRQRPRSSTTRAATSSRSRRLTGRKLAHREGGRPARERRCCRYR